MLSKQDIGRNVVPVIVGGTLLAYAYIREFNRAYGTKRCIVVISDDIKMLSSSSFADTRVIPESHDEDVLLASLVEIAKDLLAKNPDAVPLALGCDDRHALFFAKNQDALREAGYTVMCNDYDMINSICDKHNFYDLCEKLDIPYAKSWYYSAGPDGPSELPVNDFPYPLILKPSDTTRYQNATIEGKRKAYEISTPEELAEVWTAIKASDYDEEMVIQDFIPGGDEGISSLTTFSDTQGNVRLVSGGTVLLQDHNPGAIGNPLCILGSKQEQAITDAMKLIGHLGFQGYGNFDLKYDPRCDKHCFLELNVRAGRNSYYISLGGINFITPIVDQYILGQELPFREAYKPFLYCCVPNYVLKRSISSEQQLKEALTLRSKTHPHPYPLHYKPDSLMHNFWSYVMYFNQIRKFKKYFWDTGGAQYKD